MKISLYVRVHIRIIPWKFRVLNPRSRDLPSSARRSQMETIKCQKVSNGNSSWNQSSILKWNRRNTWESWNRSLILKSKIVFKYIFYWIQLKWNKRTVRSVQIRSIFLSIFSRIRTEYGDLRSKTGRYVPKKPPYLDIFYVVALLVTFN